MRSAAEWDKYLATHLRPIFRDDSLRQRRYIHTFYLAYAATTCINLLALCLVYTYLFEGCWTLSALPALFIIVCTFVCALVIPACVAARYANHLKEKLLPVIAEFAECGYEFNPWPSPVNGLTEAEVEPFQILPFGRFRSDNLFSGIHNNRRFRFSSISTVFNSNQRCGSKHFKGMGLIIDLEKSVPAHLIISDCVSQSFLKHDLQGQSDNDTLTFFEQIESKDQAAQSTNFQFFSNEGEVACEMITPQFIESTGRIQDLMDQIRNVQPTSKILSQRWLFPRPQHSQLFRMAVRKQQLLILYAIPLGNLFELAQGLRPTYDLESVSSIVAFQLALVRQIVAEVDLLLSWQVDVGGDFPS